MRPAKIEDVTQIVNIVTDVIADMKTFGNPQVLCLIFLQKKNQKIAKYFYDFSLEKSGIQHIPQQNILRMT